MYFREEGSDERSSQAEEFLERIRDAVSDMYWQQEEVPDVEALEAEETTIGEEAVHFGIFEDVNGGGNMYRGGGAKMYHGLGGSLTP